MAQRNDRRRRQSANSANMDKPSRSLTAERFHPDPSMGLSSSQVKSRVSQGLSNGDTGAKTKTEGQIIRSNIFTFFNILNFILAALVISVGEFKQASFIAIIFWNILIGSFQEIRSKRTIDKLSLISSPKATAIRDGQRVTIPVNDIVLDDVLMLAAGHQIAADSIIIEGECEVNESLITGESDPIIKTVGDNLLSGSFVVSGTCCAQTEHVGADNYANKIAGDAKYVKKRRSDIMDSIDAIIKVIGFVIVPIGILLFWKQFFVLQDTFPGSIKSVVAALIGMIPEGLILLTSVVFAVSIIRLSKYKTLVQDLYCVETLARVDTLCLDKTGTITEGTMQVDELVPFQGYTEDDMRIPLNALVNALNDDNPTFMAIKEYLPENSNWFASDIVPFSSARKWSGAYFGPEGSYIMGAGEFILHERFHEIEEQVEGYSAKGQRVLLLAHSHDSFSGKELPAQLDCIGLVLISDKIRREAPRTLRYFADQGVDLKVISGDNAVTVANIAKKAGLENADKYVDATTLETDEDIANAIAEYSVFGRVTPHQKLAFVQALKAQGHTVAMTGDGVNDVLALKEADCSIAMASGSDAARTVSTLVLLDSNFASMPKVVQEGRRAINNLQRSASLFLTKTIFSAIIGVIFIFLNYNYPFEPLQWTLISTLTIGAPSFVLALEPNTDLVRGKFLANVMRLSIPPGLTMVSNIILVCALGSVFSLTNPEISTLAVIITGFTGFMMLFRVCSPFNGLRGALFCLMFATFVVAAILLNGLFSLIPLTLPMFMVLGAIILFSVSIMVSLVHLVDHIFIHSKNKKKFSKKNNSRNDDAKNTRSTKASRYAR